MKKIIRIETSGGIASGKTTLAGLFDDSYLGQILEDFRSNPFWFLFYADPSRYAFETETTFLLQHYSQFKNFSHSNNVVICDCSTLLDMAYADVNLTGGEFDTFAKVYDQVITTIGHPDILINLECAEQDEQRRIRERARAEEQVVSINYLAALNEAVRRRVNMLPTTVKILSINSSEIDFANDSDGAEYVRSLVKSAVNIIFESFPD